MKNLLNKTIKGGILALTLGIAGLFAAPAQAITIDFSSGSQPNTFTYVEKDLTVTSLHSNSTKHLHFGSGNGGGSALKNHSGCCSTPYLLSFSMPVNLITVDFKGTGGNLFTSNKGGSFSYPGSGSWVNPGTIVDPLFLGITSITWAQTSGSLKIDNLVYDKVNVAPVPEPSTMLLLGSGLAGIVGWRYRKQQA